MLHSAIAVDLPSAETRRAMGPVEWVRSLFGAEIDLRSGKEELTIAALSLMDGTVRAFERTGVRNVISLVVDKKVVYMDADDVDEDLGLLLQACQERGVLERPFREMHLALSHKEAGLHVLVDVKVAGQVLLGEEEMQIVLTGRLEDLRVRPGETAAQYAERVRTFAQDGEAIEAARKALNAIAERLADALRTSIPGATVRSEEAEVRLIRPGPSQIGRFRQLGFGEDVDEPAYRPVPTYGRRGAYADPFYYHYYDPYYDFTTWLMLGALMHQNAWHSPYMHVIDASGTELYGSDAMSLQSGWGGGDVVSFDDAGALVVDPSIPDAPETGQLASVVDDPASAGWGSDTFDGGDAGGGSDDGGSSCSSSSCSSSSSCGSSCSSGSSCGSSCGSSSGSD